MIGVDPHKGSHTAVAFSADEYLLGRMRVRACPSQVEQLVAWARAWPGRVWAVQGATGLGGICWTGSWPPPMSMWWMCRPGWLPGSGCWKPVIRTRTTRMTRGRWRSRRCGPRPRAR
jgi:hypothetical protein